MKLTYKDLEQITGVAYMKLLQWKSFGYIWDNGDGAGTRNDPCTFDEGMIYRILWIAHLQHFSVKARDAIDLWAQAVRDGEQILMMTGEAFAWMPSGLREKKMRQVYAHHHTFLTVSIPHFMAEAESRLTNFQRVTKMRNKIGLPTAVVGERMSLVH